MIALEDLIKDGCSDNIAGIGRFVHYAYMDDIQTFPVCVQTSFETIGRYTGSFVFKPGKQFYRLYCTPELGDLSSEMTGARDGKSFGNKLEISHPGNLPQAIGFAEVVKNQDLVFVVPNIGGGLRVFGEPIFPARLDSASLNSGKTGSDTKNSLFVFDAKGRIPKHYDWPPPPPEPGGYVEDDYVDDDYVE